jgi:hypothetical protein
MRKSILNLAKRDVQLKSNLFLCLAGIKVERLYS